MKPLLWKKLDKGNIQCNICYNRCIIPQGRTSRCLSRKNIDGEMVLATYGKASSIAVDPIEKKPLYHFHPGTKVFSVGGWGCNFRCKHCQNWQISQQILENKSYDLPPEKLVELALQYECQGVCWTYNEPAIWLEYTIDSAKLAKENDLYTAYVTNGFMTIEALDLISPYLDAFRVDLKSFDDEFYQEICGVLLSDKANNQKYSANKSEVVSESKLINDLVYEYGKGVFETTRHAKKLGHHIEAVTNVIPGKNDSDENFKNLAEWIVENLGPETPWHITRFFPCYKLSDLEPTPLETLYKAKTIGENAGLKYIYLGNVR